MALERFGAGAVKDKRQDELVAVLQGCECFGSQKTLLEEIMSDLKRNSTQNWPQCKLHIKDIQLNRLLSWHDTSTPLLPFLPSW